MLALLIARPSLTACASFPIAALLALLASFSSEIHAQNSLNGSLPVTAAYPLAEESSADEMSNHASSTEIWDRFEVMIPYGPTFADGSELTVEWRLEQVQDKIQAEYPGEIPVGYVYPLTVEYIRDIRPNDQCGDDGRTNYFLPVGTITNNSIHPAP
jgi:hypothetical protein